MTDPEPLPAPQEYPRVLLVNIQAFNALSGPGITLTNLFRGWPVDRIAMIHSDPIPTTDDVCRQYYRLGADEIVCPPPIEAIARMHRRVRGRPASSPSSSRHPPGPARLGQRILPRLLAPIVSRFYLYDFVRRFRISDALAAWIDAFRPELMYVQLASVGYMRLVETILGRTEARLAIHFMDDWPMTLQNQRVVRTFLRPSTMALLRRLLAVASVRAGICERMARVYERRYGYPFLSFHNPVDPALFPAPEGDVGVRRAPFRLLFAGTVNPKTTLEALGDVRAAVEALRRTGLDVELQIYGGPPVFCESLAGDGVTYGGYVTDPAETAELHASADVLILPLNFDPAVRQFLSLSMPTKATSYMASGTPILVYAPHDTALAEYAIRDQWAYVVSRRVKADLQQAIARLCTEPELRRRLSENARACAMEKHTIGTVTTAFHRALIEGARQPHGPRA